MHYDFTQSTGGGDLSNYYTKAQVDSLLASAGIGVNLDRTQIEVGFKEAYNTAYKEFLYSGTQVVAIDIWETGAKSRKLYTKTIEYTGDNVTRIYLVDEQNGHSLTKNIAYGVSGVSNISITYGV